MKNYCFNSNIYIYQREAKWKVAEINTVRKVLKATKTQRNGLTIRLSNDKDIKVFNLKWKGINKPTNILSFLNNDKLFSFENNTVSDSPENTPFFIFSIASITMVFVVTDFAISKLSKISTPA